MIPDFDPRWVDADREEKKVRRKRAFLLSRGGGVQLIPYAVGCIGMQSTAYYLH
jgi:hypothetical protein